MSGLCQDAITCIGLGAIAWPFVALVLIGLLYLRQFVLYLKGKPNSTFDPVAGSQPTTLRLNKRIPLPSWLRKQN